MGGLLAAHRHAATGKSCCKIGLRRNKQMKNRQETIEIEFSDNFARQFYAWDRKNVFCNRLLSGPPVSCEPGLAPYR